MVALAGGCKTLSCAALHVGVKRRAMLVINIAVGSELFRRLKSHLDRRLVFCHSRNTPGQEPRVRLGRCFGVALVFLEVRVVGIPGWENLGKRADETMVRALSRVFDSKILSADLALQWQEPARSHSLHPTTNGHLKKKRLDRLIDRQSATTRVDGLRALSSLAKIKSEFLDGNLFCDSQ